ncbi:MAG: hypothetical protein FWD39_03100 [Clostridiales bacterium]|nr:hypothetical protein [Clostridiales bacterium]
MLNSILLSPPITFLILVFLGLVFSYLAGFLSAKGVHSEGKIAAYACGQSDTEHNVSPDYSQFFPFAFFFTVMHVFVLIIATVPKTALGLPLLYLGAAVLALVILFRR